MTRGGGRSYRDGGEWRIVPPPPSSSVKNVNIYRGVLFASKCSWCLQVGIFQTFFLRLCFPLHRLCPLVVSPFPLFIFHSILVLFLPSLFFPSYCSRLFPLSYPSRGASSLDFSPLPSSFPLQFSLSPLLSSFPPPSSWLSPHLPLHSLCDKILSHAVLLQISLLIFYIVNCWQFSLSKRNWCCSFLAESVSRTLGRFTDESDLLLTKLDGQYFLLLSSFGNIAYHIAKHKQCFFKKKLLIQLNIFIVWNIKKIGFTFSKYKSRAKRPFGTYYNSIEIRYDKS